MTVKRRWYRVEVWSCNGIPCKSDTYDQGLMGGRASAMIRQGIGTLKLGATYIRDDESNEIQWQRQG